MSRVDRVFASRAFTLLEMMIVVAILGIVMGMVTTALNSASVETATSTTEGALQNTTNQFLLRFMSELRNASKTGKTANSGVRIDITGSEIRFQVPVDVDVDGVVDLDTDGNAVFGATLGRNHVAGFDIVYNFLPEQVGGVDVVLDESTLGVDVNGDGDEADSFKRGYFTRVMNDGVELQRKTSDRWFLFGDGNNDTVDDPIFTSLGGDAVQIDVLAAIVMERQKVAIRSRVTTSVVMFNE